MKKKWKIVMSNKPKNMYREDKQIDKPLQALILKKEEESNQQLEMKKGGLHMEQCRNTRIMKTIMNNYGNKIDIPEKNDQILRKFRNHRRPQTE